MSGWSIFWLTWASIGLIAEIAALISRQPGATLSAQVWSLRGSGFFSIIVFFLGWLIYHFVWEGRR